MSVQEVKLDSPIFTPEQIEEAKTKGAEFVDTAIPHITECTKRVVQIAGRVIGGPAGEEVARFSAQTGAVNYASQKCAKPVSTYVVTNGVKTSANGVNSSARRVL